MADPYTLGDVTIRPQGGGYYDLTAANGATDRVRGKQKAEARAREMSAPKGDPEGMIPPQPDLDAALQQQAPPPPPTKAAPEVATVRVEEGAQAERIRASQVPASFKSTMSDDTKAAMAKIGVPVTRIVLEENESIPPTGLFVSHNGKSYMIVAGEEVDVPNFVLEVLDHAIMSTPLVDQKSRKVLGYRNRSKYPYRRV